MLHRRDGARFPPYVMLDFQAKEFKSDYRVLGTSLTKALLQRLAGRPALGRVLVVPNVFHLRMMVATVYLGTFNAAEMFWYPSPDLCLDTILSRSSTDNSFNLMTWVLL